MSDLTKPQLRALRHLATVDWCAPAMLGYAMSDREWIKPQGAGRTGGTMGTRLVKMGLARRQRMPWGDGRMYDAGYAITQAGRDALKTMEPPR